LDLLKLQYGIGVSSALFVYAAFGMHAVAQDLCGEADIPPSEVSSSAAVLDPSYVPLDLKHKYLYSFDEMAAPTRWIGFAIHAGMDQAQKTPVAWGNGADSFGVRMASHFGRSFLRENIAFGVRALDGEDPRYFRLGKGSGMKRTKYAFTRAFIARKDDGGWMPAYSRFAADFATPFLSQTWFPGKYGPGHLARGGALGSGMAIGSNLGSEFWPDIKKQFKFLNRMTSSDGMASLFSH
jgi:hypothetical protein